MTPSSASDPSLLIEAGRLLHEARVKQSLSMEDMCKKLGMRADQIQAIEEGNAAFFQKSTQPLIWFARLYAKKLGVDLPNLVVSHSQRSTQNATLATSVIPAFLIKTSEASQKVDRKK